jgi:hypothetical protein
MGAWGVDPWDNDDAADWFKAFFRGGEFDDRIQRAFQHSQDYDSMRAASYILQVLGRAYVWPGQVSKLRSHFELAIASLNAMLDPDHAAHQELSGIWGEESAVFDSIRWQVAELTLRLKDFPSS